MPAPCSITRLFPGWCGRFLEHPEDAEAQPQVERWAAKYLGTEQYDLICLFDAQGVIRMAVPVEPPISSFLSQNVPELLRSGRVTLQDFTRNEHDRRVYLALLVPIFDESDASRPLGVLAMRINPEPISIRSSNAGRRPERRPRRCSSGGTATTRCSSMN